MTPVLEFTVDGPPQGKRRPRASSRHGIARIHSDPADVKLEKAIRSIVRHAMGGRAPFEGPIRVQIDAVFEVAPSWPKKRKAEALANFYHTAKPDGDNVLKSILDGMVAPKGETPFCLIDDAQVAEQLIRKRYGSPARVDVVVYTLGVGLL